MRLAAVLFLGMFVFSQPASAQYTAQRDAQYMATLKAVVNYKINDEENIKDIEKLRENDAFNRKMTRMMNKLQNTRNKDATNRRIYEILLRAGRDIYKQLD